jgi:hypothetical protein
MRGRGLPAGRLPAAPVLAGSASISCGILGGYPAWIISAAAVWRRS